MVLSLFGCEKVPEVSFVIKTEGFLLENGAGFKGEDISEFTNHILGGVVRFSGEQGDYRFDLREQNLETHIFTLPAGRYELDFNMSPASAYGQDYASFIPRTKYIDVKTTSDTIRISVEANCSLFLVDDRKNQLEDGAFMIRRNSYSEGYFSSHPLGLDEASGLLYTYFTPDPNPADPSAFLWFYQERQGNEKGGLPTGNLELARQYYIKILD